MYKLNQIIQLFSNMGWRYISYRVIYELECKTGLLKRKFPVNVKSIKYMSLFEWKNSSQPFFFQSGEDVSFDKNPTDILKQSAENILSGKIPFFSHQYMDLGVDYDWLTNPDSGYRYDITKHWTEINDYSQDDGDIKYVWEKSRFSYLYTLIRYDYHFGDDHSEFVFHEIESWIKANPLNMGPNFKCSQEISLRILNWIFALYFYKNSPFLTEVRFQKIVNWIYRQLHHVYQNINFSRKCVRNNHAVTETLTLYIVSVLFPQFPHAAKWKRKGKKWFEQEIDYQIYDDGTFLQFSMNYHRVVIQLLTWAIKIAELNGEKFHPVVYKKAYKSINFLYQCQENSNGYLPNYGANDGALFFKLSDNDYRDYRPQLDALHILLTGKSLYTDTYEDICWYGENKVLSSEPLVKQHGTIEFAKGGYYLIREHDTLTFIRCGKHKDRPSHADNLHLDIWYKGENILLDGGSYKYNTNEKDLKYFTGTGSHNTVMLDGYDQMLKGARFIWYYWSQAEDVIFNEREEDYHFMGRVKCFSYIDKRIKHTRELTKKKGRPEWIVRDMIEHKPAGIIMSQLWHTKSLNPDIKSEELSPSISGNFHSTYYGYKEEITKTDFITKSGIITTFIQIK
jgi:hypothetical protein